MNALVPVPLDKPAIMRARERFLKLESVFTLEQFLCGWFFGAPFSSIKRGNVEELIAYGFYTTRLQELSEEVRAAAQIAHLQAEGCAGSLTKVIKTAWMSALPPPVSLSASMDP